MKSIYSVIIRRFFAQTLIPLLIIEVSLIITLFFLNDFQSKQNKEALQRIADTSFEEIAQQTSHVINQRFSHDKASLSKVAQTAEIFFDHLADTPLNTDAWQQVDGFFQYNEPRIGPDGFYTFTQQKKTSVYTTNLSQLSTNDYRVLNTLVFLIPSIKATVDTQDDLISSAWINIDKYYALAYPPIEPEKELTSSLDVTKHPFYYQADPKHNPEKNAIFLPLYKESWALRNGELGAYLFPLYHNKAFMGVIGLTLTAQSVANVIGELNLPFYAYAMLVDKEGNLIVSSDDKRSMQEFGVHSFYELYQNPKIKNHRLKKLVIPSDLSERAVIHEETIKGTDLTLMIIASKSTVFATIEIISNRTFQVGVFVVIAIALFYLFFFLFSYRSLRDLADAISSPLRAIVNFSSRLGRKEDFTLTESAIEELDSLNSNLTETHQKLLSMLIKDEDTGLFNRRKLVEDTQSMTQYALMLIRIQNYRSLLHYYGNDAASELIRGVVDVIGSKAELIPYRTADDEFALITPEGNKTMLERVFAEIAAMHVTYDAIDIHPFVFAGIAITSNAHVEEEILEYAAMALLFAQKNKLFTPVYYSEKIDSKKAYAVNLNWAGRLKSALAEDRLLPYFQPIYNLRTNQIEKFESLIRMREGDQIIPPFAFLEAAHHMGRIHEITRLMIEKVYRVAARYPEYTFSINVSFKDIFDDSMLALIIDQCTISRIRPQQIVFELLETDAIENPEETIAFITRLKKAGFSIAIDDFGTGHSNFAHLSMMKVDFIKIDGQFIKNINRDPNSAAITKTIAEFSKLMGAQSIAEFVADEAILKRTRALDIDFAQGYAISAPVPEKEIEALLRRYRQ
jgi:EAL domain-containing protein (putative c-di-GMP-specific phosphodiesterase class I)/GGDEF domain-containing protein